MEISITRALNELELLDSRINRAIRESQFSTYRKNTATTVLNGRKTVEQFNEEAKSSLQSIKDLIARRKLIKELIVASNAVTKVTVGEVEMTVASAIERKTSIGYEKDLLSRLVSSLANANSQVERDNDRVESQIQDMNMAYISKDKAVSDAMLKMNEEYREQNKSVIVDPLNLELLINTMRKDIEDFENNVDFALSEINSITKIVIPD